MGGWCFCLRLALFAVVGLVCGFGWKVLAGIGSFSALASFCLIPLLNKGPLLTALVAGVRFALPMNLVI